MLIGEFRWYLHLIWLYYITHNKKANLCLCINIKLSLQNENEIFKKNWEARKIFSSYISLLLLPSSSSSSFQLSGIICLAWVQRFKNTKGVFFLFDFYGNLCRIKSSLGVQTQTRPHVFIICPQINTVMVRQSSPVDLFLLFSPSPLLPSMWVCVCECVWPVCWFTGNTRPKEFPRWSQPYLPPIKIHELQLMILVSSLTEWLDFSWRWSDIVSTASEVSLSLVLEKR